MLRKIANFYRASDRAGRGSDPRVPSGSYCTTGQFMKLRGGYVRHCGPTAAVNVIRTLEREKKESDGLKTVTQSPDQLFLLCADIGNQMHIYWNKEILGRFGGTSNFLTPMYLRRCIRAAGLGDRALVRFHPWITPDAVEEALSQGSIVYLQVYRHPRYKNHHMLCYACRYTEKEGKPVRQFLLADGWDPYPLWVDEPEIGHGHYLTIRPV